MSRILYSEFFRDLAVIAEDEKLFAKLQKYMKRLVATKRNVNL